MTEEPTTKFTKDGRGGYYVHSDTWSGDMVCMGRVVRSDRPLAPQDRWWAYHMGGKSAECASTRIMAAELLARG